MSRCKRFSIADVSEDNRRLLAAFEKKNLKKTRQVHSQVYFICVSKDLYCSQRYFLCKLIMATEWIVEKWKYFPNRIQNHKNRIKFMFMCLLSVTQANVWSKFCCCRGLSSIVLHTVHSKKKNQSTWEKDKKNFLLEWFFPDILFLWCSIFFVIVLFRIKNCYGVNHISQFHWIETQRMRVCVPIYSTGITVSYVLRRISFYLTSKYRIISTLLFIL